MRVKVVSFKVDEDFLDLIERIARRRGVSKSELIRSALRKCILDSEEERRVIVTKKIKIYL